ncbi:hypothetical protein GQ44DRAFT_754613 [Phaeosphaeriaceae sp. PMI808]|nr:hypothetical protein GQ44DRAFT_754613 [Phaeosphaeriaceae sp. PMI808]
MEPLGALGLASNIIQIVDFSSRIVSRRRELYNSADGQTEEHAVLDNAARNLSELYRSLNISGKKYDTRNLTEADRQLIKLKAESEKIVDCRQASLCSAHIFQPCAAYFHFWRSLNLEF